MDGGKSQPMTPDAASRIQSSEARKNDGIVEKGHATFYQRKHLRCHIFILVCSHTSLLISLIRAL